MRIVFLLLLSVAVQAQKTKPIELCVKTRHSAHSHSVVYVFHQGRNTLLTAPDSCLSFHVPTKGLQTVVISSEGFETLSLAFRSDTLPAHFSFSVLLREKNIQLQEVKIRPDNPVSYRGDTLVIRTDSVRIKPHANASELLNNTPGVKIGSDGSLEVMGKRVDEVTINQKRLFGGNIKATLDALKGDMIAQIELPSQGSSLNLKLKENRENGYYGEIQAGAGTKNRHIEGLRANHISAKSFTNVYGLRNNFNEVAMSNQDQNALSRGFYRDMEGAYSVVTNAQEKAIALPDFRFYKLPNLDINEGLNKVAGLGANYSTSQNIKDIHGYALLDNRSQLLTKQELSEQVFGKTMRRSDLSMAQNNQQTQRWASVNIQYKPSPKSVLKFKTTLLSTAQEIQSNTQQQNLLIDSLGKATNGLLERQEQKNEHTTSVSTQLLWTQRYSRVAKVTSVYFGHYFEKSSRQHWYKNQISGNFPAFYQNQYLDRQTHDSYADFQLNHAIPLSRTWLFETKFSTIWVNDNIKQEGFSVDTSTQKMSSRADISTSLFQNKRWQSYLQPSFFFKNSRWAITAGMQAWVAQAFRQNENTNSFTFSEVRFLPQIYAQYRHKRTQTLYLRYNQSIKTPDIHQLYSIPDSSDIQIVHRGNMFLTNAKKQNLEFGASGMVGTKYNFSVYAQATREHGGINMALDFGALGYPSMSFKQINTNDQLTLFASIGRYETGMYYFLSTYNAWQQNFFYTNTQNLHQSNYLYSFWSVNARSSIGKEHTLHLENRFTTTGQFNKNGANLPLNFQNEFLIRTEKKFSASFYAEAKANFVGVFSTKKAIYPLLDCSVSKYFLSNSQLKLHLTAHNIFNVNRTYRTESTATETSTFTTNFLPAYYLLKATLYMEKWKK